MYKKLKSELEKTVAQLQIGDGVIVEYNSNYFVDRDMGYVYKKTFDYLKLTRGRKFTSVVTKFGNWFDSLGRITYNKVQNIRIVDPVQVE